MKYDIIIVGGGMVGISLACALHPSSLRIALIDANPKALSHDPRLIALTYSSCTLLKNLGLWPALEKHATPIKQIHVSHQGHFGITRIHASDIPLSTLGHLIPATDLNHALHEKLNHLPTIDVMRPASLKHLSHTAEGIHLTIQTETETKTLQATQVIGADGTHSTVRELLHIPTQITDYQQSALVTVTELQQSHHHIAYERFLKQGGAIAMLPLLEKNVATIWTDKTEVIDHLLTMREEDFLKNLQQEFGYRLGRFLKIHQRYTYPLKMILAKKSQYSNIILMGNAAHTLHPIASQGLNLALYEIAELAAAISHQSFFPDFDKIRLNIQLSHRLPWLFSTDFFMTNWARQAGMLFLDNCKQAKKFFIRQASMMRPGHIPHLLQEKDPYETQNIGY